jgi:hypothetical protein
VLEDAQAYFQSNPRPLAARAYRVLKEEMPALPMVRFSNGDLWLGELPTSKECIGE